MICGMVAGLLSHASRMLIVRTGCSPAAAGGTTEHHLTAALPVRHPIMT